MKKFFTLFICAVLAVSCTGESGLAALHVDGNRFATPDGQTVILRGVSMSSPQWLYDRGHWNQEYFDLAASWGCNVVRFPVHPSEMRGEDGWERNLKLIEDGVAMAAKAGMYVIIDWHAIGNLYQGRMPKGYETTIEETTRFWSEMATRYKDEPTVAMYELMNEPTRGDYAEDLGECSWHDWRLLMEGVIDGIREIDPDKICLVAPLDWAYDLAPACDEPVERDNVAYACHPYPAKAGLPWPENWEREWGCMARKAPVVCTEIGWAPFGEDGSGNPCGTDEPYGQILTDYMAERGISFTAWCFDAGWGPRLLRNYEATELSTSGKFFKEYLQSLEKQED